MVIYLILFWVIYLSAKKMLVGPIVETLEKRKEDIDETKRLKAEFEKSVEEMKSKEKNLIDRLKQENKTQFETLMNESKIEKKKIIDEARLEASKIVAQASEYLEKEKARLKAELTEQVEVAALKVAREIYLADKQGIDKKLIEKTIENL